MISPLISYILPQHHFSGLASYYLSASHHEEALIPRAARPHAELILPVREALGREEPLHHGHEHHRLMPRQSAQVQSLLVLLPHLLTIRLFWLL